jgi:hypothetical protein
MFRPLIEWAIIRLKTRLRCEVPSNVAIFSFRVNNWQHLLQPSNQNAKYIRQPLAHNVSNLSTITAVSYEMLTEQSQLAWRLVSSRPANLVETKDNKL